MLFCLLDDSVSEPDELIFFLFCFVVVVDFFSLTFVFIFISCFCILYSFSAIVYLSGLPCIVQGEGITHVRDCVY